MSSEVPTEAMMQLLAPDGYYKYLNVPKPNANNTNEEVDGDLVKKNYRKLSLKHHPGKIRLISLVLFLPFFNL
jgi:hypothetical protein